jgi:hypothetical protein
MALAIPSLQQQLVAAFKKQLTDKTSKPEVVIEILALDIATAVDAYIRTATVTVTGVTQPGQIVATPAGPGATASVGVVSGTGVIS